MRGSRLSARAVPVAREAIQWCGVAVELGPDKETITCEELLILLGFWNSMAGRLTRNRTAVSWGSLMKSHCLVLSCIVLSGCGTATQLDGSSTAVEVASSLGAPDSPDLTVDLTNYRLGPTDVISVTVFGAPELDREASIDAAGRFSLPLLGSVAAAGKTTQELAQDIEQRLRGEYLTKPSVTVNVKEAKSRVVTIDGEVREPGVYPVMGRMTLQQAIASAKGASDIANIKNIVVFRTVDGRKMAAMFNLQDIRSGRYPDPEIYGNDIVIVGENATMRFLRNFSVTFPALGRFVPLVL